MSDLDGPRAAPAGGGQAKQLVLLLHGYGADGEDLFGLAPYLAEALPNAAILAPNGPERCELNPFGYQWFSLEDRDPRVLEAGVERARALLDPFIDSELERLGLEDKQLLVLGFSQGTMTALHTLLRRSSACAGILGYSGRLLAPGRLPDEVSAKPPVMLIHGEEDEIVPFGELSLACAALEEAGVACDHLARPGLSHGIDQDGLEAGLMFLRGATLGESR